MKILFVCSANKQRSKTAEDHFSEKYPLHEFLSAGTNRTTCRKLGTQELTDELLDWADLILGMEERHRKAITNQFGSNYNNKIKSLNIPDRYKYMQKELRIHLKNIQKLKYNQK